MMLKSLAIAGAALVALTATGCVQPQNQGNALTWGAKAATGRLDETTATEWQAVVQVINERSPQAEITLTDDQAQAIVDFIVANDLASVQDVIALLEAAQADPTLLVELEIPPSVEEIFLEFGIVLEDLMSAAGGG